MQFLICAQEVKYNLRLTRWRSEERTFQRWGWGIWHHKSSQWPSSFLSVPFTSRFLQQRGARNQTDGQRAVDKEIVSAAFSKNEMFFFFLSHERKVRHWEENTWTPVHSKRKKKTHCGPPEAYKHTHIFCKLLNYITFGPGGPWIPCGPGSPCNITHDMNHISCYLNTRVRPLSKKSFQIKGVQIKTHVAQASGAAPGSC